MSTVCCFRIPTQELGLGAYHTIPLEKKASYKVANRVNNKSVCFSILAYTWDRLKHEPIDNHPTREAIETALLTCGGIEVSSATDAAHVNVKRYEPKGGGSSLGQHQLGGWGGFVQQTLKTAAGMVENYRKVVATTDEQAYVFGITAHPTADTRFSFSGSMSLKALFLKLAAEKAWSPQTLVEKAEATGEKLNAMGELLNVDVTGKYGQLAGGLWGLAKRFKWI